MQQANNQSNPQQKQVCIIHGYDAHPNKHWFVDLSHWLGNFGHSTLIPAMPNPQNPNLLQWVQTIDTNIPNPNEHTYIIGHSLGCIASLRYVESLKDSIKLGGIILVSGFYKPLEHLSELDSFTNTPLDCQKIIHSIPKRIVIAACDDEIVPIHLSKDLANGLQAEFVEVQKGGHFMESDGFNTFPLIKQILQKIL